MVIGDFNLILQAQDKSNNNLNRRLMGSFRNLVNDLELKELSLQGRRFAWSNNSTQTWIDRAFCTTEWELMLPNYLLHAISSVVSDHSPLLLVGSATGKRYRGFRFEVFWPKLNGYAEVVKEAWEKDLQVHNPFLRLHIKLQRTAKALRQWARSKIGNNKLLLCVANKLIGILDVVQELRPLSVQEIQLRKDLKLRFLGMTAIEKLRAKQRARLSHIRAADAHSKLFFMYANGKKRKNYIQKLSANGRVIHTHEDKEEHIFQHFSTHYGQPQQRTHTLNWELIGLRSLQLHSLEEVFTEEEVHAVILDLANDKAPGPDGYIGSFFKSAWGIVKSDLMNAVQYFYLQHGLDSEEE